MNTTHQTPLFYIRFSKNKWKDIQLIKQSYYDMSVVVCKNKSDFCVSIVKC